MFSYNSHSSFLQEVFILIAVWIFSHYMSTLPPHRPVSFLSSFKIEAFKIISALSFDVHPILKGFHPITSCKNNFFLSPFFAILTVTSATVVSHIIHLLQTSLKHTESVVRKKEFWLTPNDLKAIPNIVHYLSVWPQGNLWYGCFPSLQDWAQ